MIILWSLFIIIIIIIIIYPCRDCCGYHYSSLLLLSKYCVTKCRPDIQSRYDRLWREVHATHIPFYRRQYKLIEY